MQIGKHSYVAKFIRRLENSLSTKGEKHGINMRQVEMNAVKKMPSFYTPKRE